MPYIYLIHCRASVNVNENVYKIGKTQDFNKRLNGYDKGSIPLLVLHVNECDQTEQKLIQIFTSKFKRRTDYGNEYFEGDVKEMLVTIVSNVNTVVSLPCIQDNTNNIIKHKTQLLKMLNKVNSTNINMFRNNISMNPNEYSTNQFYYTLQNNISNYTIELTRNNKVKLGDYLERQYAYIGSFVATWFNNPSDTTYIKLFERIKNSV